MLNRRELLIAAAPLLIGIGCGGKKTGSKATDIELIGIESLDSLFREAKDIDNRLDSARQALRDGRLSLNAALGLTEGTPFEDAINDLASKAKGKLSLAAEGGGLSLSVNDAVPSNVQAAVDSLNQTLASYKSAMLDLTNLKGDVEKLVSAAQALPDQLQKDFKSLGIGVTELPKALSTTRDNVRIIANMPHRVEKLGTAMKSNVTTVTRVFGGVGFDMGDGGLLGGGNSDGSGSSDGSGGGRRRLGK